MRFCPAEETAADGSLKGKSLSQLTVQKVVEEIDSVHRELARLSVDQLRGTPSALNTLDIIESLEQKLGKPVVSANSASMWKMLRMLGDLRVVPGAGKLFQKAGLGSARAAG